MQFNCLKNRGLTRITVTSIALIIFGLIFGAGVHAAKYTLSLAHYSVTDPATNGLAASALYFKTYLEARTGGDIEVKIFGNMIIGNAVEYTREAAKGDTVQIAVIYSGAFSSFFPKYQLMTTPFLFPDYRTAWAFYRSKFFADMMEECRHKTGLRYIGAFDDGGGFVAFTNNVRVIKTPEDMKGLRIRTEENPAHISMMEAVGAKAVPLAWGDVTTALASGVADGQFNAPYVNAYAKLWEVNKYTSYIGFVFNTGVWLINDKWFEKLPEEYQKTLLATAEEAVEIGHGVDAQQSLLAWEEGKKHFKDTYIPTSEVKKQWQEKLRPAFFEWITKDFGIDQAVVKSLWSEVDRINKELNDTLIEQRGRK